MKKNTKTVGVKRGNLSLNKETVAVLTGNMLKQVAGGLPPRTDLSACVTRCIDVC